MTEDLIQAARDFSRLPQGFCFKCGDVGVILPRLPITYSCSSCGSLILPRTDDAEEPPVEVVH